jgi:hypothetical protein
MEHPSDWSNSNRLGLTPDRIRKGLFAEDSIAKVVENYKGDGSTFDQSDLSRLLVELMSQETCRKIVVALAEAGYLVRWKSPYHSVLVRSPGVLEAIFARHLRTLRRSVAVLAG